MIPPSLAGMLHGSKPCQYGVRSVVCGAPATTKRTRLNGNTWNVCERHAAVIDRVTQRVKSDRAVLDRLKEAR
jgi:hypothetical protein